jgi:hypothetical protein
MLLAYTVGFDPRVFVPLLNGKFKKYAQNSTLDHYLPLRYTIESEQKFINTNRTDDKMVFSFKDSKLENSNQART